MLVCLPFTAALVPGLADLFLMPLSATGSSSTSFSARELRLLGPLGFSTAALGGQDRDIRKGRKERTTQGCVIKHRGRRVNSALLRERYNTTQDCCFSSSTTDTVRLHPDSIHYVDMIAACVFAAQTCLNTYLGTKLMGVFLFFAHL